MRNSKYISVIEEFVSSEEVRDKVASLLLQKRQGRKISKRERDDVMTLIEHLQWDACTDLINRRLTEGNYLGIYRTLRQVAVLMEGSDYELCARNKLYNFRKLRKEIGKFSPSPVFSS